MPRPKRVRPPRKSTTKRRGEEKAALLEEMETLRRLASSYPSAASTTGDATRAAAQLYQTLREAETSYELWIAGLRGVLRSYEATQQRTPLRVPLVLTADAVQRRATLRETHAAKIRDAHAFLLRHRGTLDLRVPYLSLDKTYAPASGTLSLTSLQITPFPGITSVRRVLDAMQFWMSNVEICITEQLGSLTVREDDEEDGTTETTETYSSLRRIRSTLACGVPIEGNFAVFRQLFPRDEPYAVLTIQPVDEDALFPFHPDEAVRVEITGAILLARSSPDGCVTLTRWATLQLLHCGRVVAPEQREAVGRDAAQWVEVMDHVLRERVYATAITDHQE